MNVSNGRSLSAMDNEQKRSLHKLCHSASDAPGLPSFENFTGSMHNTSPMDMTPMQHPTTPNIMRPSPLDHRPDPTGRTDRWRSDSLPSIAHITGPNSLLSASPAHVNNSTHNFLSEELATSGTIRRHSIASMVHVDERRRKSETPYFRTPELRESHKIAERRRRKEMKELFDDMMDILPIEKGAKTSKWEILSKAVDYIGNLRHRQEIFAREKELLLRDRANLKNGASATKTGWD